MRRLTVMRDISLLACAWFLCGAGSFGQDLSCVQKLSPYPQLTDEIRDLQSEIRSRAAKITIDEIHFDGPILLSKKLVDEFVNREKQLEFDADDDWTSEIEGRARDFWQANGYFRAIATATPHLLGSDDKHQHYSVTLHLDEGLQYRLGDLRFRHASPDHDAEPFAFPVATLRSLFHIRQGDPLNLDRIREGVEGMTKLYGTLGYLDFTSVPEFDPNDSEKRVSVTMVLAEEKPYRTSSIEVIGLEPRMERLLRATVKVDEPVNIQAIDDFFEKYKFSLPPGATRSNTVTFNRNLANSTQSLRFDFTRQACPDAKN